MLQWFFYESKSTVQLVTNPTCRDRSKHVDTDCHFFRGHVNSGFLKLIHVNSQHQLIDPLPKTLPKYQSHALISEYLSWECLIFFSQLKWEFYSYPS